MIDLSDKALLPAGTSDVLPPFAQCEAEKVRALLDAFRLRGYERVNPPLLEFEESLLSGSGAATADQTFRLMDPESRRMMGIRPDMTPQMARIATTRLVNVPRPLRLSYAGDVLRVRGSQLRPERQFHQVGAELIGPDSAAADGEVIVMAVEALADLGVAGLSVDLGMPTLVPVLADEMSLGAEDAFELRTALDRKDAAAVKALGGRLGAQAATLFTALLDAGGPADKALARLNAIDLPPKARAVCDGLAAVVAQLNQQAPDLPVTADAVENRGFEYHTGVTFTVFGKGVRGELGSGGRYVAGADGDGQGGEPATGFTLFMDSVLRALPAPARSERIFVPADGDDAASTALRAQGRITVRELDGNGDAQAQAKRLHCTHILVGDDVRPIET